MEEVTAERYDEMLCCLPPQRMAYGAFLVGEASDHNSKGQPRYELYMKEDGKYFYGGLATASDFDVFTHA